MQHLEDFVYIAECLPQEVKTKLEEIRLIDERAERLKWKVIERKRKAFAQVQADRREGKEPNQKALDQVGADHQRIVDMHRQKKEMADNVVEMIGRYVKKLDYDTLKYKAELEEESPGITSVIESRFEEELRAVKTAARKKLPAKKPRVTPKATEKEQTAQLPFKVKQENMETERFVNDFF